MDTTMNPEQLKDMIKSALTEVIVEQRELLHEVIEEALEDIALARAIEEGENTEFIERSALTNLLPGKV